MMKHRLIVFSTALLCVLCLGRVPAGAADLAVYKLVLKDHVFTPAKLEVPAGTRFKIELTNQDDAVAEFESHDMKFEKIAVPNGTVTVLAGPLRPGDHIFVDDYRPDTKGIVTAVAQKD